MLIKHKAHGVTEWPGSLPVPTDWHRYESSASPACSVAWSSSAPVEPGWWWYEDSSYGPAPVYVGWIGFVNRQKERTLEVNMAMGEDQELVGTPVSGLKGEWYPLQKPSEQ